MDVAIEVEVDQNRCGASGLCARLAPGVFELDDDGISQVKPNGAAAAMADPTAIEEAEISCPTGAIRVRRGTAEG